MTTYETLKKQLKQGQFSPVYLFYGAETKLLQDVVKKIVDLTVEPAFAPFNYQSFDEEDKMDQIQSACEALPMMAQRKAVVVRDVMIQSIGKNSQQRLLDLLDPPNPSTVLILYYTKEDYDPQKVAAGKKLIALVEKHGTVCRFDLKDKATLKKALLARCKAAYTPITMEVCELLIDRVGFSYSTLCNEIDKLIAYVDHREITAADVLSLSHEELQNTVFDLGNAIVERRAAAAFQILDRLLAQKVEPMALMGVLTMSLGDLYRAKVGQTAGKSPEEIASDFGYGRAKFRITKHSRLLSRCSVEQVRRQIQLLEQTNLALLSSKVDNRLLLEQMIGNMVGGSR